MLFLNIIYIILLLLAHNLKLYANEYIENIHGYYYVIDTNGKISESNTLDNLKLPIAEEKFYPSHNTNYIEFNNSQTEEKINQSEIYNDRIIVFNITSQPYTLNITKIGLGTGIVSSNPQGIMCGTDCSEVFAIGSSVILTATPSTGSIFAGWGHDCSICGTNPSCQLVMNSNKTCTASFSILQSNQFYINTISNPIQGGNVVCNPNPVSLGGKSRCTITPNDGYELESISVTCPGTLMANVFITSEIYSNCTIEAKFKDIISKNAPKITTCDFNNDKRKEIIKITPDEQISYYSLNTRSWTKIPGNLSQIACAKLTGTSKIDLVGINKKGEIWLTQISPDGQISQWTNIQGILKKIYIEDLNNNGRDEIIGLNEKDEIYIYDETRVWKKIPGNLKEVAIGHLIPFSQNKQLFGLNASGEIYVYDFVHGWSLLIGNLKKIHNWKLSNLHPNHTIIGINAHNDIYYLANNSNWIKIEGKLVDLITGDFDANGVDDIIGINEQYDIYLTFNTKDWIQIKGKALSLTTGDLNGDNKDDLIVVGMDGKIYYSLDLNTWIRID